MLFRNTDIKVALWDLLLENLEFSPSRHGCRDRNDFFVFLCEVGHGPAEYFRICWRAATARAAICHIIRPESVELPWFFERRPVAPAFFRNDVEDYGFFLLLQIFKGFDEEGKIMAIDGSEVSNTEFLKKNIGNYPGLGTFLQNEK